MPYLLKPAFMHARERRMSSGSPAPEREVVTLEGQIRAALETNPNLLVQKGRRTRSPERLLQLTARWSGLDDTAEAMARALRESFPDLGPFTVETEADYAELHFVTAEGPLVTGRVLLQV